VAIKATPPAEEQAQPYAPPGPQPLLFEDYTGGLNTNATRPDIENNQEFICDGWFPIGKNNARVIPGLGPAIYVISGGVPPVPATTAVLQPSSMYLGTASGRLFPYFYFAATNTNGAGYDEGIGVAASIGTDSVAILRFAMPPTIPSGTLKLRLLALADASSGVAKVTVADGTCPAGTAPASVTLTSETQVSQTWPTPDIYVENKVVLSATPAGNDMLVVTITFNTSGWTLAAISVWIASIIWE
jgi:hypothetical protein